MARKRSLYRLHHQNATLGDINRLTPFLIQEVAPGDTWSGKVGALIRLSPLKRALLQDLMVDFFVFYVPHRLVFADWEDFIAEGPMDTPTTTLPGINVVAGSTSYASLFMHNNGVSTTTYSALRVYAYNLIWNEFFRDDEQATISPSAAPGRS